MEYNPNPGFFDFLSGVPIPFILFMGAIFTLVIGGFLYVIIKGLSVWSSNNAADVLTRQAVIVDKRTEVWGGSGDSRANTNYYITFEFEDRSRLELHVRDDEFGLLIVGDQGGLTYQGTRYKGFERRIAPITR